MKKILTFILTAIMVLSMVACSNETSNNNDNSPADSNDATVSQDTQKDETGFDASWASNEYEALLPQLPFDGWTTKMDGNTYKMELGGLNTETIVDADGKTTGYGTDKTALINYLDSLSAYGFSVEETGGIEGYVYQWEIKDAADNEFEVTCAEGYCWIEILKK